MSDDPHATGSRAATACAAEKCERTDTICYRLIDRTVWLCDLHGLYVLNGMIPPLRGVAT